MSTRYTLSVLVENKPGVLTRVAGLFARRAFNIHSLAVGQTENPLLSRITLVVDGDAHPLEQVTKQLNKLVNVIKIVELPDAQSVHRRLILIKVRATDETRANVLQVADLFRAHVVDMVPEALTIEATGSRQKIEALLAALNPYGVKEIVQSGTVAVSRGARSLSERAAAEMEATRAEFAEPVVKGWDENTDC